VKVSPRAQDRQDRETDPAGGTPIGRRVALGIIAAGAVGVVTGSTMQRGISAFLRPRQGTSIGGLLPGGGGFTLYTVTSGYPAAPADYHLEVGGMVDHPMSLSVADLRALPAAHLVDTFQCVTGWTVSGVHWTGVPLTALAARAGMSAKATAFRFTSFDGLYTESLTLEQAKQSGAIIAYSMLGAPVTRDHGGPVRLYVPAMFGYKSIKWLASVEAVDHVEEGYWEQNGYPVNAWITGSAPAADD
jgi:DMSO/TMAO reductase YedYZ molybdopterin-dependent catalytic subunit